MPFRAFGDSDDLREADLSEACLHVSMPFRAFGDSDVEDLQRAMRRRQRFNALSGIRGF